MNHVELWIASVLAISYLTRILIFKQHPRGSGPFQSKTQFVYDSVSKMSQPVTLFDYIRRYTPFNPYKVGEEMWIINPDRILVWSCPICLSFWVTFLVSVLIGLLELGHLNLLELVLFHFSICGAVSLLLVNNND